MAMGNSPDIALPCRAAVLLGSPTAGPGHMCLGLLEQEILSMVPVTVPAGAYGRRWLAASRDGAPLQIAILGPTESAARERFAAAGRSSAASMTKPEKHHRPTPEQLDERHSIPLDPELAIEALLKVDPDAPEADEKPKHDEK
jgi:hypothetical protein